MARVTRMPSGTGNTQFLSDVAVPKSVESSVLLRTRFLGFSSEMKRNGGLSFGVKVRSFKVVASVTTPEKQSKVPEIVLRHRGNFRHGQIAQVKLSGSISSQYLTALLMAAPLALGNVEIEIIDKLISIPYVEMTLKLIERICGTQWQLGWAFNPRRAKVQLSPRAMKIYNRSPGKAYVECDDSSARYFLAGVAVTGETVTVEGCGTSSLQLGATVEEGPDNCANTPLERLNITAINTYDVHRMAMVFSLAACADVPVMIRDPACTRKTFPEYSNVF